VSAFYTDRPALWLQPNNPFNLEATGVEASTSAILERGRQDAEAAALAAGDAGAASGAGGSGRTTRAPVLTKEQRQVRIIVG